LQDAARDRDLPDQRDGEPEDEDGNRRAQVREGCDRMREQGDDQDQNKARDGD